jgi:hypothetical protein
MINNILTILAIVLLWSCNDTSKKCEAVQEWEVSNYKIIKSRCPDLVLAHYYSYDIYRNDQRKGNLEKIDSCKFGWQSSNESYLILNICDKTTNEIKPTKSNLTLNLIDSVTIFSNELNEQKSLSNRQIESFVKDWNKSIVRNYKNISLDSVFSTFPAYQYKVTVFESETERHFFGYNYLVLDTSKWLYIMNKDKNLNYFHSYWNQ